MVGELVPYAYVRIPRLPSVTDTEIYVYYGNAGAADANDADTWNTDWGVVYHLKEDPAGTAPQAKDSTVNAVHGTYDIAGATVEDNSASSSTMARPSLAPTTPRSKTRIGLPSRPG